MLVQRITIVRQRRPLKGSVNEELQWFGTSLGLFGERDKDKSCFRIFIELIKSAKGNGGYTSDELAERLALSRATVIHHIHALMERGIVMHEKNLYAIREEKLSALVEDIHRDVEKAISEMKKAAEELDDLLRL